MARVLRDGVVRLDVTIDAVAVPDGEVTLSVEPPAQIRSSAMPARCALPAGTYIRTFSWEIEPPITHATVRAVAGALAQIGSYPPGFLSPRQE
jgi:hypothetical protein